MPSQLLWVPSCCTLENSVFRGRINNKISNSAEHLNERCWSCICCPGHNPYLSLSLREDRSWTISAQSLCGKSKSFTERSCLFHYKAEVQNLVKQKNSDIDPGWALCLIQILVHFYSPQENSPSFRNWAVLLSPFPIWISFISSWSICPSHLINTCPPRLIPRGGIH